MCIIYSKEKEKIKEKTKGKEKWNKKTIKNIMCVIKNIIVIYLFALFAFLLCIFKYLNKNNNFLFLCFMCKSTLAFVFLYNKWINKYMYIKKKGTSIGQFTRLLRSLELRAVSHCTVLLLWDQKLLFRIRYCFEGSIIHLPTLWLDDVDACMTCLQVKFLASLLSYAILYIPERIKK